LSAETVDLLFHFGMLASLSYTLEVGLDFALELQSIASRAGSEWILDDIAS
jgi:hypothetical protein